MDINPAAGAPSSERLIFHQGDQASVSDWARIEREIRASLGPGEAPDGPFLDFVIDDGGHMCAWRGPRPRKENQRTNAWGFGAWTHHGGLGRPCIVSFPLPPPHDVSPSCPSLFRSCCSVASSTPGHQQRITFEMTFPWIRPGGVFFCEDLETSYTIDFGVPDLGGVAEAQAFATRTGTRTIVGHPRSGIEFFKSLVDVQNRMYIIGDEGRSTIPNRVRRRRSSVLRSSPLLSLVYLPPPPFPSLSPHNGRRTTTFGASSSRRIWCRWRRGLPTHTGSETSRTSTSPSFRKGTSSMSVRCSMQPGEARESTRVTVSEAAPTLGTLRVPPRVEPLSARMDFGHLRGNPSEYEVCRERCCGCGSRFLRCVRTWVAGDGDGVHRNGDCRHRRHRHCPRDHVPNALHRYTLTLRPEPSRRSPRVPSFRIDQSASSGRPATTTSRSRDGPLRQCCRDALACSCGCVCLDSRAAGGRHFPCVAGSERRLVRRCGTVCDGRVAGA